MTSASQEKARLRNLKRAQRRSLDQSTQNRNAESLVKNLSSEELILKSQRIAVYLANDGELSLLPLIKKLRTAGKDIYLPKINERTMVFKRWCISDALTENRYGIKEPDENAEGIEPGELDLVLMPLVAFDMEGNRLGMGGGYYDRCFAFKNKFPLTKPVLIGVAHQIQHHSLLPSESWDIPLAGIMTEKGYSPFSRLNSELDSST